MNRIWAWGVGTSIIIHAVGVRSRIGFGDGDFIRAEGALQGGEFIPWKLREFMAADLDGNLIRVFYDFRNDR